MMRMLRHGMLPLVLAFLYWTSYGTLLDHRLANPGIDAQRNTFWTLPPTVLQAIAGEFKGLMANLMVLEAGAQLGTELARTADGGYRVVSKDRDWPAITRLFTTSQSLDPSFQQTYMLAQGWLPWDADLIAETQEILRTAADHRPWDWRPVHFMGFNNYYFLNDPGKAGRIFLEASNIPRAPPFLAILGSRLAQKGGQTEAAVGLMKTMLAGKDESDPGYQDMVERLAALEGVLLLERALQQYEEKFLRKPADLNELTARGILASLPPNPYDVAYCLDSQGAVHFDHPDCNPAQ